MKFLKRNKKLSKTENKTKLSFKQKAALLIAFILSAGCLAGGGFAYPQILNQVEDNQTAGSGSGVLYNDIQELVDSGQYVYDISGTLVEQILNGDLDVNFDGNGTLESPYEISSVEQLAFLAAQLYQGVPDYCFAFYKQTEDIDMSGVYNWAPIGPYFDFSGYTTYFGGHYDGNGKRILNFNSSINATFAGLFGYVSNYAVIENVTLETPQISCGQEIEGAIGTLVGFLDDGCVLQNCKVTGIENNLRSSKIVDAGSGFKWTGGLVGYSRGGIIENCNVEGFFEQWSDDGSMVIACSTLAIFGSQGSTGGIVGQVEGGTISNCRCEAAVCGDHGLSGSGLDSYPGISVGGIVGRAVDYISINDCYVHSIVMYVALGYTFNCCGLRNSISGAENAGGIIGSAYGSLNISGCHVRVQNIAATSAGDDPYAGGLVGLASSDYLTIKACTVDGISLKNESISVTDSCLIAGIKVGGFVGYADVNQLELTGSQVYENTTLDRNSNQSGAFVGELQGSGFIEGCSFEGQGATQPFFGYFRGGQVYACYMRLFLDYYGMEILVCTQLGEYPDNWDYYWAIIPGMFDDEMVSKSFYWVAQAALNPSDEFVAKFEEMAADLGLECYYFQIPPDGNLG